MGENRSSIQHISKPKTDAGIRTIPMLDTVKDAFEMLHEEQKESGWNDLEIDGMTGFIFCNRFGNVPNPQSVNRAIKRIIEITMRARKWQQRNSAGRRFCFQTFRHTICAILSVQGFAKKRPI